VKPLRGKRVGSAQSARRIQLGDSGRSRRDLGGSPVLGTASRAGTAVAGRISFRWRCAATGSGSAGKAGGEGGSSLRRRVLQPPGSSLRRFPGPREATAAAPSPPVRGRGRAHRAPGVIVDEGGLSSVRHDRFTPPSRCEPRTGRQGSAAMSVTHPTRLETRTKKSNTCASQRV